MGSETIKTSTSQLDIKDPLRVCKALCKGMPLCNGFFFYPQRLSATSLNAISCEMVVSSINITLHDSQKRSFSKKLFPLSSIIHCEKAEGSENIRPLVVFSLMPSNDLGTSLALLRIRIAFTCVMLSGN